MTETVSPEMVERMIALVGRMVKQFDQERATPAVANHYTEAALIFSELPPLVDPDLNYVRCMVALDQPTSRKAILAGDLDNHRLVTTPLACLRYGRASARKEAGNG